MMVWLSKRPEWRQARNIEISSKTFGLNTSATQIEGEELDPMDALASTRALNYVPSVHTAFTFWYKRRWVRITRGVRESNNYWNARAEQLWVCIFSMDHRILNQMLLEAKKAHKEAQENNISIYASDSNNQWRYIASRPKRPLTSIVLDPGVKDVILDDARDFMLSKSWYTTRGIPFRRGYLLYGAPGTGKTSIIHSLAGELGLNVYIISLSRSGLDDNALSELIADLPEQCIALMEDIDAAFSQTLNRDADESDGNKNNQQNAGPAPKTTSRISLSGLLNALDGVGAQEGRILFATTNKYTSLDPALCRPGRMDVHVEFKLASKYQARELFRRFFLPDSVDEVVKKESEKEKDVDSGYASCADGGDSEKAALIQAAKENEEVKPEQVSAVVQSSHRRRGPRLSSQEVEELAAKFADAVPEREFSMATLQGYLMTYKIRPCAAVEEAANWVAGRRAEAAAKAEKEKKEKEEAEKKEAERKQKEEEEKRKKEEEEKKKKEEEEEKRRKEEEREKRRKEREENKAKKKKSKKETEDEDSATSSWED
ncbi:mitochondrial chaperone bcs1 [Coprinopsis cinerea AmutBmut pab1-1]|nr:mitochondrial chaperone bcs1 [Coprinopsis cinerea AmutBmut pab1-1]